MKKSTSEETPFISNLTIHSTSCVESKLSLDNLLTDST